MEAAVPVKSSGHCGPKSFTGTEDKTLVYEMWELEPKSPVLKYHPVPNYRLWKKCFYHIIDRWSEESCRCSESWID